MRITKQVSRDRSGRRRIATDYFEAKEPEVGGLGDSQEASMQQPPSSSSSLVVSYLTLRKAIGVLGASLPFILLLGALIFFNMGIQASISAYYHTGMGDVFVGTLFAIGVFLWAYKGHESKDDFWGDVAGFSAIGVALFPTGPAGDSRAPETITGIVHFFFGAVFFLTLAYFSLFLFTKTDKPPTPAKMKRNKVYKMSGYMILVSVALIPVQAFLPLDLSAYHPVFWLESIAVVAFGVSWLTKGQMFLEDQA